MGSLRTLTSEHRLVWVLSHTAAHGDTQGLKVGERNVEDSRQNCVLVSQGQQQVIGHTNGLSKSVEESEILFPVLLEDSVRLE